MSIWDWGRGIIPPSDRKACPPRNPRTECCGKFRSPEEVEWRRDWTDCQEAEGEYRCKPGCGCKAVKP
jgi:hypothetical protein